MTVKVRRIEPGVSGGLLSEYEGDPHFMNITESEYTCVYVETVSFQKDVQLYGVKIAERK